MDPNIKNGLLALGGGALGAVVGGVVIMSLKPAPQTNETLQGYEARLLAYGGVGFGVLGAAALMSKNADLRMMGLGLFGLSGAGLLSAASAALIPQSTTPPVTTTTGAMMGIRAPAVLQMDAAMHHKKAPATTWINTNTAKRW